MTETTPSNPVIELVESAKPGWRRFVPSKTNVALATAVIVLAVINTKQANTIVEADNEANTAVDA